MIDVQVHLWDVAVRDQPWLPAGSPIGRTFGLADRRAVVGRRLWSRALSATERAAALGGNASRVCGSA